MAVKFKVGGEIVSWCTKCKLILDHTIVALVDASPKKVKCHTCKGHHNYREKAPVAKSPGKRRVKQTAYEVSMSRLGDAYDFSSAKKYSMKGKFKVDQVIDHASFGIGFVISSLDHKIEALFEGGPKRLVQNR